MSTTSLSRLTSAALSMLVAPSIWYWLAVRFRLLSVASAPASRAVTASAKACSSLVLLVALVAAAARNAFATSKLPLVMPSTPATFQVLVVGTGLLPL